MPTLALKNTFSFYKDVELTMVLKSWLNNMTAIEIIINQLKEKLHKPGRSNKLYFLRGRTGSGKSTYMITNMFEKIIKGSRGMIICSEPRVVLTKANATDDLRYNKQYHFGKEMGVLTGSEKIRCTDRECMYYCTPQILNDRLLKVLFSTDENEVKKELSRYTIVVVDEVHVLDLPMLSLMKTVKDIVDKYSNLIECPIFMFTSATINLEQMIKYYFPSNANEVVKDPFLIGDVAGSSNFPVVESFLTSSEIATFNKEESDLPRGGCFEIMARYFYEHLYEDLFKSESFVTQGTQKIQCRDVLFFVPLSFGIETIGETLKKLIKDKPVYAIKRGTTMEEVTEWRNKHRGEERVLVVGFARDFSSAADVLLSKPIETDPDALIYETRIVIATSVIETGKTITTLYQCIDMGLDTTSICNPLSFDFNNVMQYLKQIPANVNKVIQRLGRVGREAPGRFLHFYSKEIMDQFQLADTPDTINNSCLSNQLLSHYRQFPLYKEFNVFNENNYLYPTTVDIILRSINDMITAGFFTVNGEFVNLKSKGKPPEAWVLYAGYLYYILKYSLFEALMLSAVNRKALPSILTVRIVKPESLKYSLDEIARGNQEQSILEGIKLARNTFTKIKYGLNKDESLLAFLKDRQYGDVIYGQKKDVKRDQKYGNKHGQKHGNKNRGNGKNHSNKH